MNTSNAIRLVWLSCGLLFLASCGQEEPVTVVDEAPVADELLGDAVEEATSEVVEEPEDETLEVVAESAAEVEESGETAIILAQADTSTVATNWQFEEGTHYVRFVPSQPTVGGADKIEVAEFFWYGCPHCYDLEPAIVRWDENKPANVRFVRVPAMWNDVLKIHAQLYYTEEVLVRNGVIADAAGFRNAVFDEYHRRGNRLLTEEAIIRMFERFGASVDDFRRTWASFEVAQKMRVANDLARRYAISSVPTIVVNGKYRTSAQEAGSYQKLFEVIDELVVRESAR